MKGLSSVLFCIVLALAPVACGQDKGKATAGKATTGKATAGKKATTLAQSKEPTQKKSTKAQKKAPTQAQKKQQDRMGDCNKQANLKNMKGEERKTFVSKCLGS